MKRYSISKSLVHQSGQNNKWSGMEKYGLFAAVCIVLVVVTWIGVVVY